MGSSMDGRVPQCASFFEVVDSSMEAAHMEPSLVIPMSFIKKFHSYLNYMITLEAPSGVMFKALIEIDKEKHFRITFGWKELAEHLGIRSGNLLILELVFKDHFRVYVYDEDDKCEKNLYVIDCEESYRRVITWEPTDDGLNFGAAINERERAYADVICTNASNGKTMILSQDVLSSPSKYHLSKSSTYSSAKKRGIEESKEFGKSKGVHIAKNDCMEITTYYLPSKVQNYIKPHFTLKDLQQVYQNLHVQTQQAFENAVSYSSTNPFFIRMMIHSNVCSGYSLHMSADQEHVVLIDARKRAWSVTFLGHKNDHITFSAGWKHFVLDHELKCGDICIFEKMSTKALTAFNVHTFRVHKADRQELLNKVPPKLSSVIARGFT
ncbi:hypothetical protein KP509_27G039600 [Ceratopteris richardii]|uniref:TF-B3 domain-containing protein n=1 Tax=Ceratopteris richardii TaxID=49495 RepID=A0A8T2RFI7_CERRI|nr:hypothetical protein KP509_27G039600 [Ceratopteris richardii]